MMEQQVNIMIILIQKNSVYFAVVSVTKKIVFLRTDHVFLATVTTPLNTKKLQITWCIS
jgi:hypothetical protein